MCNSKPGLRCSPHAAAKLMAADAQVGQVWQDIKTTWEKDPNNAGVDFNPHEALHNDPAGDIRLGIARFKAESAKRDYNATPEGMKALAMRLAKMEEQQEQGSAHYKKLSKELRKAKGEKAMRQQISLEIKATENDVEGMLNSPLIKKAVSQELTTDLEVINAGEDKGRIPRLNAIYKRNNETLQSLKKQKEKLIDDIDQDLSFTGGNNCIPMMEQLQNVELEKRVLQQKTDFWEKKVAEEKARQASTA